MAVRPCALGVGGQVVGVLEVLERGHAHERSWMEKPRAAKLVEQAAPPVMVVARLATEMAVPTAEVAAVMVRAALVMAAAAALAMVVVMAREGAAWVVVVATAVAAVVVAAAVVAVAMVKPAVEQMAVSTRCSHRREGSC